MALAMALGLAASVAAAANPPSYSTDFLNRGQTLAVWTPQEECAHCSKSSLFSAGPMVGDAGKDKDECTNMTVSATTFVSSQTQCRCLC